MKPDLTIWTVVLGPALGLAVAATIAAVLLGGCGWTAFGVAVAVLSGPAGSAVLMQRHKQIVGARLRRPELRTRGTRGTGIFADVLEEAVALLDRSESESRTSAQAKRESEALANVRQKRSRRFESALETIETPVVITDSRDELIYSNPAATRLFQATASPTVDPHSLSKPDLADLTELNKLIQQTRSRTEATNRRTAEFDVSVGQETFAYRATATAAYDEENVLLGVVAVLADIRDERVAKSRHAEFVSSVSHEMKTPMAGMKAFLEMLLDGDVDDPAEQKELYTLMDTQIDRLTRMVNNLLNLARIESGVIKIQREDLELNDVLRKSAEIIEPVAGDKQIRVIAELSELYMAVHVDPDLFGQAIINLLSNSVKYTPAGGEVRLRSRMEENQAVIEVRDTGMGIPANSLPHIFDRFYRVPENNKAAAGTGLGLALVQYIVTDVHNGQIAVDSTVGVGTCFTVTIPLGHRDHKGRKKSELALAAV